MSNTEYIIERSIDDIEFGEHAVEEAREKVQKDLIEEGISLDTVTDELIEERLEEELVRRAKSMTEHEQGDNSLTRSITHSLED